MSLEMRPDCERCGADLPADARGALICSFECTYCEPCGEALSHRCPNCGGDLAARPTRARSLHARHPPATERRYKGA